MMWARTTVKIESCSPIWEKIKSAEMPATISGTTSGISIRMLAPPLHLARERTSPIASIVPRIVPATIDSTAISSEANRESTRVWSLRNSSYHCSENPSKFCSDLIELKLKRMTTKIGANRNR